ncbi:hypothetical protein PAXRUDRAFT_165609 [Paxillus rubicundulus Ve08.2h10]|uniref:Uncharacterized protein n=1 Tax=Paxillus rubicundulus Ve08.2h10 TaxID=930991 RepID=A0A0D0C3U8_9AGAM|nr:hypothetical protein PAXRUDRAFT_165609 [Paxillus rubicundulus Ve08.2h10]
MGHHVPDEPPCAGLAHTPRLPSLSLPITLGPSPMGHPIPNKPPSTGLACTPQLTSLSPPIALGPSPMGHPLAHTPQLPSLSPPVSHTFASVSPFIPSWCHSLSPLNTTRFQSTAPPITSYYCSVLHILYRYTLSYLTLGQPIHYGQLHSWAHP